MIMIRHSLLIALICLLLPACGSRNTPNTIRIGNAESSAIKLSSDGLTVNPGMFGLEDSTDIEIHTSSDNEITFDIRRQNQEESGESESRAF